MVVESDAFASGSSHQWLEPCQMHLASVAAAMGICLGFPATAREAEGKQESLVRPRVLIGARASLADDRRGYHSGILKVHQESAIPGWEGTRGPSALKGTSLRSYRAKR